MYFALKHTHVLLAVLSILLFLFRGTLRLSGSALIDRKWLKITPHVIDTLLLATAVALTFQIRQYPFGADWLTVKLLGLVIYIALGVLALRVAKTRATQAGALLLALLTFAYIVAVAISKSPLPFAG